MGSKPKAKDYQPSELEKLQASVAAEEQRYFEGTYQPLLEQQRDLAARERLAPTLKGRAQADTMQELTGGSNLALSQGLGQSGNIALGAVQQQLGANVDASLAGAESQLNVLGTATGQRMLAGDALANAARLKTSEGLAAARAKQQVRMARNQALVSLGMNTATMAAGNMGSGSGSIFKRLVQGFEGGVPGSYNTGFFGLRRTKDPFKRLQGYGPSPRPPDV